MQAHNNSIPTPSNIAISVFKSVTQQSAHDYTLQQFIDITTGATHNRYAPTIAYLRTIDKSTDKTAYKSVKEQLCVFTISCRCPSGASTSSAPDRNNGVLCVDIDGGDNPHLHNWGAVRDALGKLKFCYMSALSAGGRGVFLLMAVDPATPHEKTFEAAEAFFASRLNIKIDPACRNIGRLRYISHDPYAVVQQPTEMFRAITTAPPITRRKADIPHVHDDFDRVRAAVRLWVRQHIALEDFDDWTHISAALKALPDGESLLNAVSQFGRNYNGSGEISKKFIATSNMNKIGVGTFFAICEKYGITKEAINAEWRGSKDQPTARPASPSPKRIAPAAPPCTACTPEMIQPENAPTEPRAPGETEQQARERNAAIINAAWEAWRLMGAYKYGMPTIHDITIIDPAVEPPRDPPF